MKLLLRIRSFPLLAVLLVSPSAASANSVVIDQVIDATCAGFLAPILGRQELSRLTVDRTIDSRVVCACAKDATRKDPRLTPYLEMSESAFLQRAEDLGVRSYIVVRALQSVLTCFSTELEATMGASKALK